MNDNVKRSFDLTAEQSSFVDRLVSEGRYRSPDDVVARGLAALADIDPEVDAWQVAATRDAYDRLQADPSRAIDLEEAWERLERRHRETLKTDA